MNKGQTIPCPLCKQILIRFAEFYGPGRFQLKCSYCQKKIEVKVNQQCFLLACKVDSNVL